MKNIPWKGIFIGCAVMTVLVIAKGCVTAGMTWYYGGTNWWDKIFADPWTYVGMATAMIGSTSCAMWQIEKKKTDAE